ncbi:MAG TPA: hypothetical protein VNX21_00810 [Candidatus Thermoplasmatota archaeon]|nr:hypothetical protein [Candidatus Thermoplasmatota archaeon]
MRATTLMAAALLLTAPLALVASPASAFGYCTSLGVGRPCYDHVVCIGGGSHGTPWERCQYSEDLCEWLIYCGPGPVLA